MNNFEMSEAKRQWPKKESESYVAHYDRLHRNVRRQQALRAIWDLTSESDLSESALMAFWESAAGASLNMEE